MPERYWYPMYELMSERKACEIENISKDSMINLLINIKRQEGWEKIPRYIRMYESYFMIQEHPCLLYRIKRIKKYKKWGIRDYLMYPLVMIFWILTGRGWSGR